MSYLIVENLTKTFMSFDALHNVSFSAEKGEIVVFIGNSGSGKTTLLRCLNGLTIAEEGTIKLNGQRVFAADKESSAKRDNESNNMLMQKTAFNQSFGLVFQSFNLFPHLSVLSNVTLAAKIRAKNDILSARQLTKREKRLKYETCKKEIISNALLLLERIGIKQKALEYPCQLSGGQSQRAAIVRALMLDPDVICFDEPTSALDPVSAGEVANLILSIKSNEKIILVVTHDMNLAKTVADKVIFIDEGEIKEQGTPNQLFDFAQSRKLKEFLTVKE